MVKLKLREIFLLFLIIPILVQVGLGSLVITIVDVNDFPPAFDDPAWTPQSPMVLIAFSLLFFMQFLIILFQIFIIAAEHKHPGRTT